MFACAPSCWPLHRARSESVIKHGRQVFAHCQGRFVRWGDTSSHDAVRGLNLRWDMSSRILSGMVAGRSCRREERSSRIGRVMKSSILSTHYRKEGRYIYRMLCTRDCVPAQLKNTSKADDGGITCYWEGPRHLAGIPLALGFVGLVGHLSILPPTAALRGVRVDPD